LKELEREEEAIIAYKRSLMLDPFHAKAHHHLGSLLKKNYFHEQALSSLEEAYKLNPDDLSIARELSVALSIVGRNEEAIHYMGLASQFIEMYAEGEADFVLVGHNKGAVECPTDADVPRRVDKSWR